MLRLRCSRTSPQRRWPSALLLVVLLFSTALQGALGQSRPLPPLDAQEQAWRRAHPVVQVGVFAGDHMPVEAWVGG